MAGSSAVAGLKLSVWPEDSLQQVFPRIDELEVDGLVFCRPDDRTELGDVGVEISIGAGQWDAAGRVLGSRWMF